MNKLDVIRDEIGIHNSSLMYSIRDERDVNLLFVSVGGGILFGRAAGYAIKKAMKIAIDDPIDLFSGDYDEYK